MSNKVPGITARRKASQFPVLNSDMVSSTTQNETKGSSKFAKVDEVSKDSQNGYRMEMKDITDDAIQQIEDLAISSTYTGGGLDIQATINRIGTYRSYSIRYIQIPSAIIPLYKSSVCLLVLIYLVFMQLRGTQKV